MSSVSFKNVNKKMSFKSYTFNIYVTGLGIK